MIDTLPVGFADVTALLQLDNRDDFADGMVLRGDGIYVKPPPPEATAGEAAALSKHPTGNLATPALSLPTNLGAFACFLEEMGLYGMLEPLRVAEWAVTKKLELLASKGGLTSRGANWRWPWGAHETALLRHLAAAGDHFWANYDPSDTTSAPTSEEVKAWLKKRDVADRVAEVMAQILRADGLAKGPRK
jgi:hypothetical protein